MRGEPGRLRAAAVARVLGTPLGPLRWVVESDVPVPVRDGTVLRADVYHPVGPSRGTVLVRDPYGREGVLPWAFTRPFVSHGYHVVYQSCRGTFGSGGSFEPARTEAADGTDTVAWMREQPWYTGSFATLGGSYTGFTQWALRADEPHDLAASVIAVGPHDLAELAWDGGAFRVDDVLGWAESIATQEEHRGLQGLRHGLTRRRRIAPALDSRPVMPAARELLGTAAAWFDDWMLRPDLDDEFWEPYRLGDVLDTTRAPVLLLGGWHDVMHRQTLEQYRRLSARGVDAAITMGPWAHGPDLLLKGAVGLTVREALDWFDHHLAGEPLRRRSRVRLRPTRGRRWQAFDEWPADTTDDVLHVGADHALTTGRAVTDAAYDLRHDRDDPVLMKGGNVLFPPSGVQDDRVVEGRADVLVLTGPELTAPTTVLGAPSVTLRHWSDGGPGDLHVRLCSVDPGGRSSNISDGHVRVESVPGAPVSTSVPMGAAFVELPAGTRLRLLVSASAHPMFASSTSVTRADWDRDGDARQRTVLADGSSLRIPVRRGPPGPRR